VASAAQVQVVGCAKQLLEGVSNSGGVAWSLKRQDVLFQDRSHPGKSTRNWPLRGPFNPVFGRHGDSRDSNLDIPLYAPPEVKSTTWHAIASLMWGAVTSPPIRRSIIQRQSQRTKKNPGASTKSGSQIRKSLG